MTQKQNKQLAKKQTAEVQDNSSLDYKGNEEASASDIIVPKLLLMQGTSPWVPERFNLGDLVNSVEEELLAARGEVVEILPFVLNKTWQVFTRETPPKWVRQEPWHEGNDQLEWEFSEEDPDRGVVELKRQRQYGFYAFIVKKEVDPFPVPVLVNFRSSAGFKEGKKIASHFAMMKGMGQPGFNVIWKLSAESVKSGDKSFQKFVVQKGRMATKEETEPVLKWLTLMNSGAKIVDHDVEETDETVVQAPPVNATAPQAEAQF